MVKVQTKEKLAKLLAMEDIDVEHRQVKTAMFDVKSRCLVLPTWKDMPNHLYDLLVGHEVGHALYTPADENTLKNIIGKTSKHCVNVVEDARIEALMKRRYPGLVKQFFNGYSHLIKEDFFGLSKMDMTRINLLDKINLHFKVPSAVAGLFEFNETEQSFIDRIENVKNFKEVEELCIEICEYIKENRTEEEQEDSMFDEDSYTISDEDFEDGEEMEMGESQPSDESAEEESEKGDSDEGEDESGEDEGEGEGEDSGESDEDQKGVVNSGTPNKLEDYTPEDLKSQTYENFEDAVSDLADIDVENVYATIPDNVRYDNLIDYKQVYKNIDNFFSVESYEASKAENDNDKRYTGRYSGWYHSTPEFVRMTQTIFEKSKITLSTIKRESVKNVNHMAMEFERKKSADIYKRTSFSKTGVLDTNKMFSAKYNEDVFKKNIKTPDGKNHGLVMIVDWSGSMSTHLQGCGKQIIEFVLFCKKVNIPFEVYSFSDINCGNSNKKQTFIYKPGDLTTDDKITLRNYFSSRMNARELNNAMLKFCVITDSFSGGYQQYPIPEEDALGYTPLNGAILFSEHVVQDFKKRNNLQEVHMVFITDGEGNNQYGIHKGESFGYYSNKRLVIQDKKMKKSYPISKTKRNITDQLLKIVKDRIGCNVVGFFLDAKYGKKYEMMQHIYRSGLVNQMNISDWLKQARKDGYFVKTEQGYDEYYVINNAPKIVKPVEMNEKMTNRKLATVFSSNNNQFKNSRVILSKFIDLITARI